MFDYQPGKLNYIVPTFHTFSDNNSGGNIALHKLAFELAIRNNSVLVFAEPEYPHPNIVVKKSEAKRIQQGSSSYTWEPFTFPIFSTVTVMPEVMGGNFFGTKYMARWILYHTQKHIEDGWGENDVYFNYGTFTTSREVPYRKLTIMDYHFDKLYDEGNPRRKGFCHILHKTTPSDSNVLLDKLGSQDIKGWFQNGGYDFLRTQLNKYEYFLTYDHKTFMAVAAVLCGTKVIVLNEDKKTTPLEYRLDNPIFMYGVAYGMSDIQWANDTIHMARQNLESMEEIDKKSINEFDAFWRKKLNL
jgi:hypothetical protein